MQQVSFYHLALRVEQVQVHHAHDHTGHSEFYVLVLRLDGLDQMQ